METDSLMHLLRHHFEKVNKCLENTDNLNILTGNCSRSTFSKLIENEKPQVNYEYTNPELEYAKTGPSTRRFNSSELFPNKSIEYPRSETFQEVMNSGEESLSSMRGSSVSLSRMPFEKRSFVDDTSPRKTSDFRRDHLERPETPMLEVYEDEDSRECCQMSTPREIRSSKKFFHSPQSPVQIEEVPSSKNYDDSCNSRYVEDDFTGDTSTVRSLSFSVSKSEQNEEDFQRELEEYKKDAKIEKIIRSWSAENDISKSEFTPSINKSLSYDSYSKSRYGETSSKPLESFPGRLIQETFDISRRTCISELESDTNITSTFPNDYPSSISKPARNIRDYEDTDSGKSFHKSEGVKASAKNFIMMNHLEIQKEMTKKIEDMYKPGDVM